MNNVVYSINGPVIKVKQTKDFSMLEMVYVGTARLVGEVISITDEYTTIQVYETTTGLKPGEPVFGTGTPLSVLLGPGIISGIFDGIERPLKKIEEISGFYIDKGIDVKPLDSEKLWDVKLNCKVGDFVDEGQIFAVCPETPAIEHRCMIPPGVSGQIIYKVENGKYTIDDTLIKLKDKKGYINEIGLSQKWPIRTPRPIRKRVPISKPLLTGQRVIDSLFPIAKGGTAAIPGGFGTGKTLTQHQLAKWCDADIIVYIGCGERGNEMTQVLKEFAELIDPKSKRLLTDRTVLIANTSNMPVAAREASIYTGVTLAEYYRDMGYDVAIMADSTSRWAEALREISGRLEEMPAEEGFPAYLPSRIAQFYERAGEVNTLAGSKGSVTIIGAVSPQGADFSEPVTQNTKRFVRCFWALDKGLAYRRHYPAINWNNSYTDYIDDLENWYYNNTDKKFLELRQKILSILYDENILMETVKLIGADVLPDEQRLIIETARIIRVGFLQQNAYHQLDTYVPILKQQKMMETIVHFYEVSKTALTRGVSLYDIIKTNIPDELIKMKFDIDNENLDPFLQYLNNIDEKISRL